MTFFLNYLFRDPIIGDLNSYISRKPCVRNPWSKGKIAPANLTSMDSGDILSDKLIMVFDLGRSLGQEVDGPAGFLAHNNKPAKTR